MLNDFLAHIDFDAVKRMKHRLFVVGRFNDNSPGPFPELFLFKHPNRPVSDDYALNFKSVGDLSFRSFLDKLKPTVYEVIEPTKERNRFTQVKMLPPSQVSKSARRAHGQYSLNELNWFVIRGFASTDQPAFKGKHPSLPRELLTQDSTHRGREIYRLIRQSLHVFGRFQPRTFKLIEAFSTLFGQIGAYDSLPAYGTGNPLPPGLPEALIDFLYLEDTEQRFSLKNVDLSAEAWLQLRTPEGEKTFCSVVSAFRDEIVGKPSRQYNGLRFGGRSIHDLAHETLDQDLVESFRAARDAYSGLRQILRGKVLISMILQWVLQSLDEIPEVKALGPKAQDGPKDRAKGKAILKTWAENGLAKPVNRPKEPERRRFKRELKKNFDLLLTTVTAMPEMVRKLADVLKDLQEIKLSASRRQELTELRDELRKQLPTELIDSPDIWELAVKIARDEKQLKGLRGLMDDKVGEDYKRSFINAAKILLTDVLCPTLFQDPIFTSDQLRRFFRSEMMTVYLMSVFLDNKTKDETVRVAEAHQAEFQTHVDPETRLIRDSGKLQGQLLADFVTILTRDELRVRLDTARRVLSEAYTVLENTPGRLAAGDGTRVSGITSFVPDPIYRSALETDPTAVAATDVPDSDLLLVVERIALQKAQQLISAKVSKPKTSATAASQSSGSTAGVVDEQAPASNGGPSRSDGAVVSEESSTHANAQAAESVGDMEHQGADPEQPESGKTEKDIAVIVNEIVDALPASTFEFEGGVPATFTADRAQMVSGQVRARVEERHRTLAARDEPRGADSLDLLQDMKDNMRAFQSALFLVYQRYNENSDKREFHNNVDRFTLVNLMLLFQNELGLGDVHSSLMHLLLDLVLYLDKDDPDPKTFLEERSLTIYFDNDLVDPAGMTSLRQVLEMQAQTNLQAMINLVSEIMGIRHLIESVSHDKDAEVIVVNATATEFLDWVDADNLNVQGGAKSRLNPIKLMSKQISDGTIPPGLVYLSDAAFDFEFQKKLDFFETLQNTPLSVNKVSVILPPFCVSTGRQSEQWRDHSWYNDGLALAGAAAQAPCPVIVLGPSSFLNSVGDAYATFIPAGYIFGAHFLSRPSQGLRNVHVQKDGEGRFFTLGFGVVDMKDSLDRVIWGQTESDHYAFAADYYLYIVLTILTASFRAGMPLPGALEWRNYYDCFYNTIPELVNRLKYDSSHDISEALYGPATLYPPQGDDNKPKPAYHYAMAEQLSVPGTSLKTVFLQPPRRDIWLRINVEWFDRARIAAGLP